MKRYEFVVLLGPGNVNEGYHATIEVLACNKKMARKNAEEKCKEWNLTLIEPVKIHPKTI